VPRIAARSLLVAASFAVLGSGLAACGGSDAPKVTALTPAQVKAELAKSTTGLSAEAQRLERAAGTVLPGSGKDAPAQLDATLKQLRGTPVVVNLWGDWCVPCKKEMPLLQRTALAQRGKVVFVGVATLSSRSRSADYLQQKIALPYPSILDNPGDINQRTGIDAVPKTFFYSSTGKRFIHQGPYETQADLEADIKRYASAG